MSIESNNYESSKRYVKFNGHFFRHIELYEVFIDYRFIYAWNLIGNDRRTVRVIKRIIYEQKWLKNKLGVEGVSKGDFSFFINKNNNQIWSTP